MIKPTSLTAYEEILPELGERQILVLKAIRELCKIQGDCTDQEIKRHLGKAEPNFVRPRRNELVNDFKLVGYNQKRECQVTGKTALAWKVLDRQIDKMIMNAKPKIVINKEVLPDY